MSYQFLHIESYGRKGSVQRGKRKHSAQDVANEAERLPEASRHVEHPKLPRVLYGVTPSEAVVTAYVWADTAFDARGRKLRSDAHVLLAGVISLPESFSSGWLAFSEKSLGWLKDRYSDQLLSVVEHVDESNPHLHFYVVPESGRPFASIHDGEQAARQARKSGAKKGAQNAAYIAAMRALQDDFWENVAKWHGLARLGPARRRVTREQWKAEQVQAQLLVRVSEHAASIRMSNDKMSDLQAVMAINIEKLQNQQELLIANNEIMLKKREELLSNLNDLCRRTAQQVVANREARQERNLLEHEIAQLELRKKQLLDGGKGVSHSHRRNDFGI